MRSEVCPRWERRAIDRISGAAPLIAIVSAPILATLWARGEAPTVIVVPLLLIAAAVQLSTLWRFQNAERLAHALTATD